MMLSRESLLLRWGAMRWGTLFPHLIPWLNVLLLLLLAYVLAGISWRIWPASQDSSGNYLSVPTQTQSISGVQPGAALVKVAAMHLFGEADVAPVALAPTILEAPETRLSLTLKGIVATSVGGLGRALIAEGSATEEVYRVGDVLSGGAVLHEVLADKVILKRGERFETLTLPRERVEMADTPPSGRGNTSRSSPIAASRSMDGGISEQLRTLRDVVVSDPQQAFSLVQAQPVMEGGVMKGYRVNPGKERKLFSGTGLRPGDVVTSVNGIALSDTAQLATLFAQFKSADSFNLVVERGGRQTSLTIDLGKQ